MTTDDPARVIYSAVLSRGAGNVDVDRYISLCTPPPYLVSLVTERLRCRTLCPNSPSTRRLTAASFTDGFVGRYARVQWGFREGTRVGHEGP